MDFGGLYNEAFSLWQIVRFPANLLKNAIENQPIKAIHTKRSAPMLVLVVGPDKGQFVRHVIALITTSKVAVQDRLLSVVCMTALLAASTNAAFAQGEGAMAEKKDGPAAAAAKNGKMMGGKDDKLVQLLADAEKRREAAMRIRKPLLGNSAQVDRLAARYKKWRSNFQKMMSSARTLNGPATATDKKNFDEFLRYRVLETANEDAWENAVNLRRALARDLKNCAQRMGGGEVAKQNFRKDTMDKVIGHCQELLDNQLVVRINAALLIGQLDMVPGSNLKSPVPYIGAIDPMLDIINDPNQLEVVKIAAVRGLERTLRFGTVGDRIQDKIADALLASTQKGHPDLPAKSWLDRVSCRAMSQVKTSRSATLDGLLKIIEDSDRDFSVRTAAAYAVGRTGMDPQQADRVAMSILKMVFELGNQYNKNTKDPLWRKYLFNTYLAFRPHDDDDPKAKIGLLKRNPTRLVNRIYEQVKDMLNYTMEFEGRPIPPGAFDVIRKTLDGQK